MALRTFSASLAAGTAAAGFAAAGRFTACARFRAVEDRPAAVRLACDALIVELPANCSVSFSFNSGRKLFPHIVEAI
jgi:hypothetical protein